MSDGLVKEPCPSCRENGDDKSGDNLVVYPDGRGAHCFACGYHVHGEHSDKEPKSSGWGDKRPIIGVIRSLPHRKIDKRTCQMYDYRLAKMQGKPVEVANYYGDDGLVAQHLRPPNKEFRWRGDTSNLPLFGQHLWSGTGKRIVVTEGEIDCLTVSMLWGNRWPVVSIPNGTSHAPKAIKTNLAFLSGYDEIVLCFDNDEPGRAAVQKCADLLPPGKVRITSLPYKDANACLLKGESKACLQAIYEARTYQPDGILHASDVDVMSARRQKVWGFPWKCLTKTLMGQRSGEMTLLASGTGSGKSTVIRELAHHALVRGRRVGMLMLEESPSETMDDLISLKLSKPVRQIMSARELNAILLAEGDDPIDFDIDDNLTDEEYAAARQFYKDSPLYIYDHHGSNEFGNVLQRVEYMAMALSCDVIYIDHVTALIAGLGREQRMGSEREAIDDVMKRLRSIVERTGTHLVLVSQLNRLDGKAAEEGGQISLKNLRGSGSLGSVPNSVLAIERDQQADDPAERSIIKVRSLKGRFTGDTGIAGYLKFNSFTRRLEEADWSEPNEQQHEPFDAEPDLDGLDDLLDEGESQQSTRDALRS